MLFEKPGLPLIMRSKLDFKTKILMHTSCGKGKRWQACHHSPSPGGFNELSVSWGWGLAGRIRPGAPGTLFQTRVPHSEQDTLPASPFLSFPFLPFPSLALPCQNTSTIHDMTYQHKFASTGCRIRMHQVHRLSLVDRFNAAPGINASDSAYPPSSWGISVSYQA